MRRNAAIFMLVIAFLAAVTGAVSLFHHHDDGPHHDCQTCFLIKVAGLAVISFLILLTLIETRRRTIHAPPALVLLRSYLTSASPRGPPSR